MSNDSRSAAASTRSGLPATAARPCRNLVVVAGCVVNQHLPAPQEPYQGARPRRRRGQVPQLVVAEVVDRGLAARGRNGESQRPPGVTQWYPLMTKYAVRGSPAVIPVTSMRLATPVSCAGPTGGDICRTRTLARGLLGGETERLRVEQANLPAANGDHVPEHQVPHGAGDGLAARPHHLPDRRVGQAPGDPVPRVAPFLPCELQEQRGHPAVDGDQP